MAKKVLKTADGKPIKPGMKVVRIATRDGGKSWGVGMEQIVHSAEPEILGAVKLCEPLWHCVTAPSDNRIFASEDAAEEECQRRNATKKKSVKKPTKK